MTEDRSAIQVIEKRRFLRLNDYFKVSFQPATEFQETAAPAAQDVGYSKNLSLGGIAFVTESHVEKGEYLRATIQIPELDQPVEVVGQIVRISELGGGKNEIAIKFLPFGIDEDQRNQLELFIYDHFLSDPMR